MAQLVSILSFLRSKNIIHRDLKPGNILFNDEWHLVLADFGTAKLLSNKTSNASTTSESILNKSLNASLSNSANTTPKNEGPNKGVNNSNSANDLTSFT